MAHKSADVVANKQRQETPTPSTLGISTIKPKFPHYAQISKRFESFEEAANPWPKHSPVKIEDLVEAGLVYTNVSDSVRCYHSGGGLRNWEDGDSPMEEYAKWYPNCQHVLIAKGKQFIQQIGSGQRPETDGQIQNQRPAVHKKDPFEKDKIIIQTLKKFDFSEDQSKQAIQLYMLKNGGKKNYEVKDLMVILCEVAENPEILDILNNHKHRTAECSIGMERMTVDDKPEDEDAVYEGSESSVQTYYGNYKKQYDDCLTSEMIKSYCENMKSVGGIFYEGRMYGTGFRVGTNCITTAFHVVSEIINPFNLSNCKRWMYKRLSEVYIDFNDGPLVSPVRKFNFSSNILYYDILLDVVVLEIAEHCDLLPAKLSLSAHILPAFGDYTVAVIGYGHIHKNKTKHIEQCPVIHSNAAIIKKAMTELKKNEKQLECGLLPLRPFSVVEQGYTGYDLEHKLIVHAFMEHGISGSPMMACLNHDAKPEVVGVFTHAMPECYFCIKEEYKILIPPEYRFEAGARMSKVHEDMKREHLNELIKDLFT